MMQRVLMEAGKILRIERVVIVALLLGAVFGLLYAFRNALIPVFVALFLAYVLDPVVNTLEGRRIHREAAIFILALVSLIVVGLFVGFLLYEAQKEVVAVYHALPGYLTALQARHGTLIKRYLGVGIPHSLDEIFTQLKLALGNIDPAKLKPLTNFLAQLTSKTVAFFGWLFAMVLIPVFLFYFLRDWDELKLKAVANIPLAYRDYLVQKFRQIDDVLSGFIRGQLTVCLILGILYSIGLSIVNINLAVVIGILSGAAYIVPYLGTAVGVVAASIMALLQYGLDWHLFGAWLVFAVVQALEGSIITPRIMGKRVGLHPVVVIIAVLIGADLLGFLGILVAVPTAAVLNVFIQDIIHRYQNSDFFLDRPSYTHDDD
jgi:predicted PurR-regulated permease PerM